MMRKPQHTARGFTLIELMIVVAILAVLSAVAIVAYTKWVTKSKDSEATAILADVRIKQEAYRGVFHQYANINDKWVPPGSTPSGEAVSTLLMMIASAMRKLLSPG